MSKLFLQNLPLNENFISKLINKNSQRETFVRCDFTIIYISLTKTSSLQLLMSEN